MRALLLAAGYGKRLQPITISQPKCLVDIGGKPLLGRWLDTLGVLGVGPVLVNLHHLAGDVQSYIAQRGDSASVVTVYESALLGTAGTIRKNRGFFGRDKVMVIHADNLCLSNLLLFKQAHNLRPKKTQITMLTFRSDDPTACGIVEVDDDIDGTQYVVNWPNGEPTMVTADELELVKENKMRITKRQLKKIIQ
mgnify:CR=1 FL=1